MLNVRYLTYAIVTHCTLKCDGCITKSELRTTKSSFIPVDMFKRDVEAVAKFMRFEEFAISGGEALQHKKIIELLKIVKNCNIAKKTKIHTNGQLIDRQPEEFWQYVDKIVLSLYPNTPIDNNYIRSRFETKCKEYNIILEVHMPNEFMIVHADIDKNRDTQKVFDECLYVHAWECHTLHNGKYYKCFVPIVNKIEEDGVPIEETAIREYIENTTTPLKSCYSCFGTSGPRIPHRQVT